MDNMLREAAGKIMRLIGSKAGCIIHHWDMDGVAAAATLAMSMPTSPRFYVPPYTFKLTGEVIDEIARACRGAGALFLVDYNVPGSSLDLVWARIQKPVVSIDHHTQPDKPRKPFVIVFNPAAEGDPRQLWPSAAHVVASLTGMYKPLLVALSIVGDLREKARANRVFQKYMVEAGMNHIRDFDIMAECVSQVMAADIMGRRDILVHLASRLSSPDTDPCMLLLQDGLLSALRSRAEEEYRELYSKAEEKAGDIGSARIYRLEGYGRHVSTLARELARRHPDRIVVVVYYWIPFNRTYIYVRTEKEKPRLIDLAETARAYGITAGGKYQPGNNVVGMELAGRVGEDVVEKIVSWITRLPGRSRIE